MTVSTTTQLIRVRSVSVIASDVPSDMTLTDYRKGRCCEESRREKMRAVILARFAR